MVQVDVLALIFWAELLGILAVLGGIAIFVFIRRSRKDRGAVRRLIEKIKQSERERTERLRNLLAESHHCPETELVDIAALLIRAENRFYKKLIALYVDRDEEALVRVGEALDALLGPYRDLLTRDSTAISGAGGREDGEQRIANADEALQAEIERVQEDNRRLSGELRVAMESMSKILSEYAIMYGSGQKEKDELGRLTPERLLTIIRGEDPDQIPVTRDRAEAEDEAGEADPEEAIATRQNSDTGQGPLNETPTDWLAPENISAEEPALMDPWPNAR